jgi:hypothetical protein
VPPRSATPAGRARASPRECRDAAEASTPGARPARLKRESIAAAERRAGRFCARQSLARSLPTLLPLQSSPLRLKRGTPKPGQSSNAPLTLNELETKNGVQVGFVRASLSLAAHPPHSFCRAHRCG